MAWVDRMAKLNKAVFAHLPDGLAVFRPKTGPVVSDVAIIIAAPEILAGLADVRTVTADATVEVAVDALTAAPAKGDRFEFGDKVYVCADKARRRDVEGATWIVDVEIRAAS